MHDLVSLNHEIINSRDAGVSAVSNAGLYGKGVFTTIAVRGGSPFLFDKHWMRLEKNAEALNIPLEGMDKRILFDDLDAILTKNNVVDGRCRITVFDSSDSAIWNAGLKSKTAVLILTGESRRRVGSFLLSVSTQRVLSDSPLNNIKSCNYLGRVLALETAKEAGFSEAVRINERNEVVSAVMANLFWIKNGEFFTPASIAGCLEGTTRAFVMERCEVKAVIAGIDDLIGADSVFLTSAGFGIRDVSEIVSEKGVTKFKRLNESFYARNRLQELNY